MESSESVADEEDKEQTENSEDEDDEDTEDKSKAKKERKAGIPRIALTVESFYNPEEANKFAEEIMSMCPFIHQRVWCVCPVRILTIPFFYIFRQTKPVLRIPVN